MFPGFLAGSTDGDGRDVDTGSERSATQLTLIAVGTILAAIAVVLLLLTVVPANQAQALT